MVFFFSVNSTHSHLQMLSEFCEDISCPSHVSVYHLMTNLSFLVQKTAPLLNVMWSHFVSSFLENNDFWEWCFQSLTQVTQKQKICQWPCGPIRLKANQCKPRVKFQYRFLFLLFKSIFMGNFFSSLKSIQSSNCREKELN